jgi:hypothetical protein
MYEVFIFLLGAFSVKSDNGNARISSLEGCHLETIRDNENCDKVGLKSTADSNTAVRIFLSFFVQDVGQKSFFSNISAARWRTENFICRA